MFIAKVVVISRCNRLFFLINKMLSFQRHVQFLSLYIYHCSVVVDFSSEKYSGSFYRTQELLVPAEKYSVRMPMVRLELATPQL